MSNLRNQRLLMKELEDAKAQKNFEIISDVVGDQELSKFDWNFIKFSIPATISNLKIPHGLNFIPTDILTTQISGILTFNYSLFDDKFLDVTALGPCNFRGLVGRHRENNE